MCERSFDKLKGQLGYGSADIRHEILVGPAAQSIVEYAEKWDPRSSRLAPMGRGFWKSMWLGSVADQLVAHHVPCSVVVNCSV
jgi:nucleotide-binding universal stress UspA family protein